MRHLVRVLVEFLAPPSVAATVVAVPMLVSDPGAIRDVLPAIIMYSYLFAFLPSGLYAFAMEVSFYQGLAQRSWTTVSRSSIFGACAGVLIGIAVMIGGQTFTHLVIMVVWGIVVGAITGFVIRLMPEVQRKKEPNQALQTTPVARSEI